MPFYLLSVIHSAPTVNDFEQGIGPEAAIHACPNSELAQSEAGQESFVLGIAALIVDFNAREGMVTFRLGRSPDSWALPAASHTGQYMFTLAKVHPTAGDTETDLQGQWTSKENRHHYHGHPALLADHNRRLHPPRYPVNSHGYF